MILAKIATEAMAEAKRADIIHGSFPTIQHAAAVLRREEEEAWAEVWLKPVKREALRMELLHVAASAMRFIRLLDDGDAIGAKPWPNIPPQPLRVGMEDL